MSRYPTFTLLSCTRHIVIGMLLGGLVTCIDAQLAQFVAQDLAEIAHASPKIARGISIFDADQHLDGIHAIAVTGNAHRMRWIGPLSRLENLRSLSLEGNRVVDIDAISQLKQLRTLSLLGCEMVEDCSALGKCKQLRSINLRHTSVTNVEVLSQLPELTDVWPRRFGLSR